MTSLSPVVDETARSVLALLLSRDPTLGSTRLLCVDGPAGSGKTTLSAALLRAAPKSRQLELVHMDDLYEGWSGLEAGMRRVADDVITPLRHDEPGRYRRYDWVRGELAEEHLVTPVDVLVVEGVGAGNVAYADDITVLVWVETPSDVRLDRGISRDGEPLREHWQAWKAQEDAVFAEHRARARADVVVDGRTGLSGG